MRRLLVFAAAALSLFAAALPADIVARATRDAILRDDPDKDAPEVSRMKKGETLQLWQPEQSNGFYRVTVERGKALWVSRYLVRLESGPTSTTPPRGQPERPSANPSQNQFHLQIGVPTGYTELSRDGFVIGYDPRLKIPAWVQYRLTRERNADKRFDRLSKFSEDEAIPPQGRATSADYKNSGYAQGHMAPADDQRWSKIAVEESNFLSNVAPQVGTAFNGSVWKTLENRVRRAVESHEDITIITGPVFTPRPAQSRLPGQPETTKQIVYNVVGAHNVAVPSAFFKILVDVRDPSNPDARAYLIPHQAVTSDSEKEPDQYLTTIDAIEESTGLDFLTALPANVQARLEAQKASKSW